MYEPNRSRPTRQPDNSNLGAAGDLGDLRPLPLALLQHHRTGNALGWPPCCCAEVAQLLEHHHRPAAAATWRRLEQLAALRAAAQGVGR